jgi:hypothetical protein
MCVVEEGRKVVKKLSEDGRSFMPMGVWFVHEVKLEGKLDSCVCIF